MVKFDLMEAFSSILISLNMLAAIDVPDIVFGWNIAFVANSRFLIAINGF